MHLELNILLQTVFNLIRMIDNFDQKLNQAINQIVIFALTSPHLIYWIHWFLQLIFGIGIDVINQTPDTPVGQFVKGLIISELELLQKFEEFLALEGVLENIVV